MSLDHARVTHLTRRQFVAQSAVGAAGALAMTHTKVAQADDVKSGWIDAHVHVWTPDTEKYRLAAGYTKEGMAPPSFTPEELLAQARPCGVSRITLIQMSFYKFDNSYMLDTMARFPGVFSGVAVVDSEAPTVAETMVGLKAKGVRGFRLAPWANDPSAYFGTPGIQTMWQVGARERLNMCLLINPNSLPVVDRMCQKYPDTPVVIDHFARIGVDGTVNDAVLKELCDLAKHKQITVKLSAFYALGKKTMPYDDLLPMIRRLIDAYGVERLMWATDCPFQVQNGHTYESSIALIRDRLDGSKSDKEWLLKKTAEKVFFS